MVKFKVGDKVKVLAHAAGSARPYLYGDIGSVGVIQKIDTTCMPFNVSFGDYKDYKEFWFKDDNSLELVKETQPTKSLNEKRYEWFKTYMISDITIDSLENELVDCNSSREFDAAIDKYSALIAFNKL